MAIQLGRDQLQWRVSLNATPDVVFAFLSTDRGREAFWAESSNTSAGEIMMVFPDGSTTTVVVVRQDPPYVLEIVYFGTPTRLVVQASGEHATELRVTASSVPPDDMVEIAAGWVSVLLNLKVAINFGKDLRNHDPTRTWVDGFIDN